MKKNQEAAQAPQKPLSKAELKAKREQEAKERFQVNSQKSMFKLPGVRVVKETKLIMREVEITAEGFHNLLDGDENDRIMGATEVKKWSRRHQTGRAMLTGETIIRDTNGHMTNAWHRGMGLIDAQEREDKLAALEKREAREFTFNVVAVEGVDPETTKVLDTGRLRRHKDALYSQMKDIIKQEAGDENLKDAQLKVLCAELGHMALTVFRACHGVSIRDSQAKFEHDTMIDFILEHTSKSKRGVSMIKHLYFCYDSCDGRGRKSEGCPISSVISLGQFAAITYLARVRNTPVEVTESECFGGAMLFPEKPGVFDDDEEKITSFLNVFSEKENAELAHPARVLKQALIARRSVDKKSLDRDETNDLVRLALTVYLDDRKIPQKDMKIKAKDVQPYRLGGFDTSEEWLDDYKAEHWTESEEDDFDEEPSTAEELGIQTKFEDDFDGAEEEDDEDYPDEDEPEDVEVIEYEDNFVDGLYKEESERIQIGITS